MTYSDVFIDNFEKNSYYLLVFLLSTYNSKMLVVDVCVKMDFI